jgi:hypothetical protein
MKKQLRKSFGSISDVKMYPVLDSKKTLDDLKTVALWVSDAQAVDLARMLLNAAHKGAKPIAITGFRQTGQVTVTARLP